MISRMRKYRLATLRNCSNRFLGKKVMILYLEVYTEFFCKHKNLISQEARQWLNEMSYCYGYQAHTHTKIKLYLLGL